MEGEKEAITSRGDRLVSNTAKVIPIEDLFFTEENISFDVNDISKSYEGALHGYINTLISGFDMFEAAAEKYLRLRKHLLRLYIDLEKEALETFDDALRKDYTKAFHCSTNDFIILVRGVSHSKMQSYYQMQLLAETFNNITGAGKSVRDKCEEISLSSSESKLINMLSKQNSKLMKSSNLELSNIRNIIISLKSCTMGLDYYQKELNLLIGKLEKLYEKYYNVLHF